MKVKEVMSNEVVTVTTDTTLKEVAEILAQRGISGLPVIDCERVVVGVVSEADILFKERGPSSRKGVLAWLLDRHGVEGRLKLEARNAREAMSSPAVTIEPQRSIAEAAHIMLDKQINRLPVVDGRRLVGIVTRADLVRAFARPDDVIEREIRQDVLGRTLWLRDPAAIAVTVEQGRVTLRGAADSEADAELVGAFVARVPGVVEVVSDVSWPHENGRRS